MKNTITTVLLIVSGWSVAIYEARTHNYGFRDAARRENVRAATGAAYNMGRYGALCPMMQPKADYCSNLRLDMNTARAVMMDAYDGKPYGDRIERTFRPATDFGLLFLIAMALGGWGIVVIRRSASDP